MWKLDPDPMKRKKLFDKLVSLGGRPETTLEAATRAKYGEYFPRESARRLFETGQATSEKNKRILFAFYCGFRRWKAGTLTPNEEETLQAAINEFTFEEKPIRTRPPNPVPPIGRLSDNALACMITYSKFVHLRDMQTGVPIYSRRVERLNRNVDVFDEFFVTRTLFFKGQPEPFTAVGRRFSVDLNPKAETVVDIVLIYPPKSEVVPKDQNVIGTANTIEHFETEPKQLWEGAFTAINGFQRGNETARSFPTMNCDRIILMVDMTSIPVYANNNLFTAPPIGKRIRPGDTRIVKMHVEQYSNGIFVLDTDRAYEDLDDLDGWIPNKDTIKDGDNFEMRFSINWDVVAAASK